MDRDTQTVVAVLRTAVQDSGLTQSAFATALGTSNPRLSTYLHGTTRPSAHFCVRAGRLGWALGHAAAQGFQTAPAAAAAARLHVRDGELDWVWRVLLQSRDHLRAALASDDTNSAEAWEAAPGETGDRGWDALFAALVGREFTQVGEEPPGWATPTPLPEPWIPPHPFLDPDRVRARTPDWLRDLNLFVPARDLVTA